VNERECLYAVQLETMAYEVGDFVQSQMTIVQTFTEQSFVKSLAKRAYSLASPKQESSFVLGM